MSDTNKELLSESEIVLALNEEFGNEMAYMNFEMDMRHARAIERAVLEKIALAPGLSGWLEIASAPKDGTGILLGFNDEEVGGFVGQGRWHEEDHDGPDNMGHDAGFMDDQYDFFKCARSFGNPAYQSKGLQPTHWQPLPAAPGIAPHQPQSEGETSGCMANEAAYGEAGNPVVDELTDFVVSRWHAEVKNRPLVNKNRRPLDDAWRQMLRHLGVDDRARLGPTHDELLEASNG